MSELRGIVPARSTQRETPALLLAAGVSPREQGGQSYEAARVLENHYAAQLRRHHHDYDDRQQPLWPDDQPPF